jgi:hypothetical protein
MNSHHDAGTHARNIYDLVPVYINVGDSWPVAFDEFRLVPSKDRTSLPQWKGSPVARFTKLSTVASVGIVLPDRFQQTTKFKQLGVEVRWIAICLSGVVRSEGTLHITTGRAPPQDEYMYVVSPHSSTPQKILLWTK